MCQDFANPFGGADVEVAQIESNMTAGSHHMLLFFQDNATDSDVVACDPLQFSADALRRAAAAHRRCPTRRASPRSSRARRASTCRCTT